MEEAADIDARTTCVHEDAVFWNSFNRVVQCHRCGQVFVPEPVVVRIIPDSPAHEDAKPVITDDMMRQAAELVVGMDAGMVRIVGYYINKRLFPGNLEMVEALVTDGLQTDGAHHKQWYIERLGELLGMDISKIDHVAGIAA